MGWNMRREDKTNMSWIAMKYENEYENERYKKYEQKLSQIWEKKKKQIWVGERCTITCTLSNLILKLY